MTYNYHVPLEKMMCHFFEKSPEFYKELSSKPVVLCRVLLDEITVASRIKRLGSPMIRRGNLGRSS